MARQLTRRVTITMELWWEQHLAPESREANRFHSMESTTTFPCPLVLNWNRTRLHVALWMNGSAQNQIQLLIDSSHGGSGQGWALQLNSQNNLSFAYGNGGTSGNPFPEVTTALPGLGDGDFHHVAAIFDGSSLQLYVDGSLGNSLAYTGTATPSGRDIRIGNHYVFDRPFLGQLDDIRIYDEALSASQVMALASGVPEPSSGMIGAAFLMMAGLRRRK